MNRLHLWNVMRVFFLLCCFVPQVFCDKKDDVGGEDDSIKPTFHHKHGNSEIFVYDQLLHAAIGKYSAEMLKQ